MASLSPSTADGSPGEGRKSRISRGKSEISNRSAASQLQILDDRFPISRSFPRIPFSLMKRLVTSAVLAAFTLAASVFAADKITVTATHELGAARPSETLTIPWADVAKALPGALLQKIA